MSARSSRLVGLALIGGATLLLLPFSSGNPAIYDPPSWQLAELVDLGDIEISPGAGKSVRYLEADESWHAVYTKAGEIYHATRSSGEWSTPEQLSFDPAESRNPYLAAIGNELHVVWEDERSGQPEVWTRRFGGTSWTAEECMTCDGVASSAPTIADSKIPGDFLYLTWVEHVRAGSRIQGREYRNGAWGEFDVLSQSSGDASQPTVGTGSLGYEVHVAWTDTRYGDAKIFSRARDDDGEWGIEWRMDDLPGTCSNPTINMHNCCFDNIQQLGWIAFENDASGVSEIYVSCFFGGQSEVHLLSEDDGIPSYGPSIDAATIDDRACFPGGRNPLHFATWSEDEEGGVRQRARNYLVCDDPVAPPFEITHAATSNSAIGAKGMSPDGEAICLWADGTSLNATPAEFLGCQIDVLTGPPSLLIAPEGYPNAFDLWDSCSGLQVSGGPSLKMYGNLEDDLAWDPAQDRPTIYFQIVDGEGELSFRGGGCSQAGPALVNCWYSNDPVVYDGVRSPDVDGNCLVDESDLEYVQGQLGTDEYCADLDGSGIVDQLDVDIVLATLGDECSTTVDVTAESASIERRFFARPNPSDGPVELWLRSDVPGTGRMAVFDISGRVVARLPEVRVEAGASSIDWDLRDQHGRSVPQGIYLIDLQCQFDSGESKSYSTSVRVVR